MLKSLLLPLLAASFSTGCMALDNWNCDESPYLTRFTGVVFVSEPACAEGIEDCAFRVGAQESLIVWGRSCDAQYPLEIVDVRVEPPIAEWRVESLYDGPSSDDTMVVFTPKEAGSATVRFEYSWQGGTKEFQTEIRILPKDTSAT